MPTLAHKTDCTIDRCHPDYPASAVLFNCDGDMVCRFDEEWTDDQIWAALEFANRASRNGFSAGERTRAAAIRSLIEPATI